MKKVVLILPLLLAAVAGPPPAADPATVTVRTADADRFAALFRQTRGRPSAAQLQARYLTPGSYGVQVFTPNRIEDAAHLASAIGRDSAAYRDGIARCLPAAKAATPELRAIYSRLHAIYPDRPLPQIYVVFGAGNSGGTAGPGAQVLGLEVLCRIAPDKAALSETFRTMFAHETVHTWQREPDGAGNPLLDQVLVEGAADYIASLALGATPSPARAAFAGPREAELWRQFQRDVAVAKDARWDKSRDGAAGREAMLRWIGNYDQAPDGWPYELGYWIGMRIWERYVANSADKAAAMRDVLEWRDADAIVKRAGGPVVAR